MKNLKNSKNFLVSMIILMGICTLTGCNQNKNIDRNTIVISKDGSIIGAIIEEFKEDYYSSDELQDMVNQEIAEYNREAGGEKITLDSYEITENHTVNLHIKYASFDEYSKFNETILFAGTVSEAYDAGYEFVDMTPVAEGDSVVSAKDVLEMGSSKLVIFEEPVSIRVSGKITHISEGVSVSGKKEAAANEEGMFYIIYN